MSSHSHGRQPESQHSAPRGQRPERSTTSRGTLRSIPSLMSFGTVGRGASSLRLPVTESESSMRPVSARQADQTITHGTSQEHGPGSEMHSTQPSHFGLRRRLNKLLVKTKDMPLRSIEVPRPKKKAPEYPQSSRATVLPSPAPPRKGLWQKVKFEWRQKNSLEEFA